MDRFPIMQDGTAVGELLAERGQNCTVFDVTCRPAGPGPWCIWAVGDRGELRLGVLERAPRRFRFSPRMTLPLGMLLRGEVRPSGAASPPAAWRPAAPESLLRSPRLCRCLRGVSLLYRRESGLLLLAIPYEPERPFPLMELFCFGRLLRINDRAYLRFTFDSREQPVF